MHSRLVSGVLVLFLLATSLLLGLAFGGVGLASTSGGAASQVSSAAPNSPTPPAPYLLVIADRAVFPSGSLSQTSGGNLTYTMVPFGGLPLTLTKIGSADRIGHGRPTSFQVVTNSSGELYTSVSEGNYTVIATGLGFDFSRTVEFHVNVTTVLKLDVIPFEKGASSVAVMNKDTVLAMEPGGIIFAKVAGNFAFQVNSTVQLTGWALPGPGVNGTSPESLQSSQQLVLPCVVTGDYQAIGGSWVVLEPLTSSQSIPTVGVVLVQYLSTSEVSYLPG